MASAVNPRGSVLENESRTKKVPRIRERSRTRTWIDILVLRTKTKNHGTKALKG